MTDDFSGDFTKLPPMQILPNMRPIGVVNVAQCSILHGPRTTQFVQFTASDSNLLPDVILRPRIALGAAVLVAHSQGDKKQVFDPTENF